MLYDSNTDNNHNNNTIDYYIRYRNNFNISTPALDFCQSRVALIPRPLEETDRRCTIKRARQASSVLESMSVVDSTTSGERSSGLLVSPVTAARGPSLPRTPFPTSPPRTSPPASVPRPGARRRRGPQTSSPATATRPGARSRTRPGIKRGSAYSSRSTSERERRLHHTIA